MAKKKEEVQDLEKIGLLAEETTYNKDQVEDIVKKMKKKYKERGVSEEKVTGDLAKLRSAVTGGAGPEVRIESPYALKKSKSPIVRVIGGIYLKMQNPMTKLGNFMARFPGAKALEFNLYCANLPYTATQYVGLVATAAIAVAVLLALLTVIFSGMIGTMNPGLLMLAVLGGFFFTAMIGMIRPGQIAQVRGKEIDKELPFALRHLATEIRAGVSLHRGFRSLATGGYGTFSEEMSRTIREMDEGLPTEDALENLRLRTKSIALKRSTLHIIRAVRTGGNLSEVIGDIAEEVSSDLRLKMVEFSEKMNFIGVLFIVFGIVLPVLTSVLAGIRHAPIGTGGSFFQMIPLTIPVIIALFGFVFPAMLAVIIFIIKASEPTA